MKGACKLHSDESLQNCFFQTGIPAWPDVPGDMELMRAVLTTYDLNPDILSSFPADPDRMIVFYGNGDLEILPQENARRDELLSVSFRTVLPSGQDGFPTAYIHGKLWLMEYGNPSGDRFYILSVHSANLCSYRDREAGLLFYGHKTDAPRKDVKPLCDYLEVLIRFIPKNSEKRLQMQDLMQSLACVHFLPDEKNACESFSLIGPGMKGGAFLNAPYDELLIVSPLVDPKEVSRILTYQKEGARSTIVSNLPGIVKLLRAETKNVRLIPLDEKKLYLHAKVYFRRLGDHCELFCGSMNLTKYALYRNAEFMVHVKDPQWVSSSEELIVHLFKDTGKDKNTDRTKDPSVSTVLTDAAAPELRQAVLTHILRNKALKENQIRSRVLYLLSEESLGDLAHWLLEDGLPSVPLKRRMYTNDKPREYYVFPMRDKLLLSAISRALHRYDGCFSDRLFLHVKKRSPVDLFAQIRENAGMRSLFLFKTDISDYDSSMDADLLISDIRNLPGIDPCFCDFMDRLLHRRSYRKDKTEYSDGPAVLSGCGVASFCGNVYLRDMDFQIAEKAAFYCRCADDILIGAQSQESLNELVGILKRTVEAKKLRLNTKKTQFIEPGGSFQFIGWQICGNSIDFSPEVLKAIGDLIRLETKTMLIRYNRQKIPMELRLFLAVRFSEKLVEQLNLERCFRLVSSAEGLGKIDAMMSDMIRTLATKKTGKGKYRISYETLRYWGYRSLVNRYYRQLR